jgi:hypothetical protein
MQFGWTAGSAKWGWSKARESLLGSTREPGEHGGKARDAEADGEPGVPPAELLVDQIADASDLDRPALRISRLDHVEVELAVLLEHAPEHRVRCDHLSGIVEPVELGPCRSHHLLGVLVGRVPDGLILVGKADFDVFERHGHSPDDDDYVTYWIKK